MNIGKQIGFCQNHMLICYSPFCDRSKILIGDNSAEKIILRLLADKIAEICKRQKILFGSFLFVSEFNRSLMESLENLDYLKSQGITTLYLDVKWDNFDDYLSSLKHKTRQNARREIKKCKENAVTIRKRKFEDLAVKLSELISNNQKKYSGNSTCIFGPSFLSSLSKYGKDKTVVFIAEKKKKINWVFTMFTTGKFYGCFHGRLRL
jgi:predicted N-acyltransferase